MLDLNGHLRALSKSNWRCTIKWKRGFTFEVLLDGALKYEHFSAVEGAPDSLSEGTPSFKIEIEDLLEITFELHLEMHSWGRKTNQCFYGSTNKHYHAWDNFLGVSNSSARFTVLVNFHSKMGTYTSCQLLLPPMFFIKRLVWNFGKKLMKSLFLKIIFISPISWKNDWKYLLIYSLKLKCELTVKSKQ